LSSSAAGESGSRDQVTVEGQGESWCGDEMTTQIPDWASVLEVLGATESACVEAEGHVEGHNLTSSRAGAGAGAQQKGEGRCGRRKRAEKAFGKGHPAKVSQQMLGESSEFCVSDFARSQMIKMGYDFEKGQVDFARISFSFLFFYLCSAGVIQSFTNFTIEQYHFL